MNALVIDQPSQDINFPVFCQPRDGNNTNRLQHQSGQLWRVVRHQRVTTEFEIEQTIAGWTTQKVVTLDQKDSMR